MGKMKQLLGILHRHFNGEPDFSESDLKQIIRWSSDFKNKEEVVRLLSELADMNHLRRVAHAVKTTGRPGSQHWQIHRDSKLVATSINSNNTINSEMPPSTAADKPAPATVDDEQPAEEELVV